jgi:hypothetical protein
VSLDDHAGQALADPGEKITIETAERKTGLRGGKDLGWFADRQDLEKEPRELDETIVRAPGMLVPRPDLKANPTVAIGRGIEIAHCMHYVVETPCHFPRLYLPAARGL